MDYDLNLLRTFAALMKERSVTAASQDLGLTQPAVSGSLAKLRQLFGDPLFTRTRYGIVPTPKAEAIAPIIQKTLAELDAVILGEREFDPQTSTRQFQIAANSYFECVLVPHLAKAISQQAPKVTLKVIPIGTDLAEANLSGGVTQLALGRFDHPQNPYILQDILSDEFVCIVRSGNSYVGEGASPESNSGACVARKMLTSKAYETMKHVIVAPPRRLKTGVFKILKNQSIQRDVAIAVSHFLAVFPIIATTDYCATLPKRIALMFSDDSRYRILAPPKDFGKFPMHMVWHHGHSHDDELRWLRQIIQNICEELNEMS